MNDSPFRRLFRRAGLILLCLSMVACSTVRTVPMNPTAAPSPFGRKDDLRIGDDITVRTAQGEGLTMKITALEPDALEGLVDGRPHPLRLKNDEITEIKRKEISVLRTGLVAASSTLFVVLTVVFAGVAKALIDRASGK